MNAPAPRHPLVDLLARYRAILKAAWAHRHELAGPKRLADELAFQPAALSLQDTPVHPAPRRVAWALCALFLIALAWSVFGRVDIVAVAQGQIVVSERTKLIQPLDTAVVHGILVRDGQQVRAGQVLVELDATMARADTRRLQEELADARSEAVRSQALLHALDSGRPPELAPVVKLADLAIPVAHSDIADPLTASRLNAEWADITARLSRLAAEHARRDAEADAVRQQLAKLEQTLPIARQRERDFTSLVERGFIAGHAVQDRVRERIELERDLATQKARLREVQAAQQESARTREAYLAETRRQLHERHAQARLQQRQMAEELSKAQRRQSLTRLTAPVAGTVQQVAVHTQGGVVTSAQTLMIVVPDDAEVTAEVIVQNKDIGFVHAGQEAKVKLETFPYTRYGTVPATVRRVSADAVNDERLGAVFPAVLTLGAEAIDVDGKRIRLGPGMTVTAEVATGKRRVIEYLLSPIQRRVGESLRER